jgi:hypothetical protein
MSDRRRFLQALAALGVSQSLASCRSLKYSSEDPFKLVASAIAIRRLLWTRLVSGFDPSRFRALEIAADSRCARGSPPARGEWAHAIFEPRSFEPIANYWIASQERPARSAHARPGGRGGGRAPALRVRLLPARVGLVHGAPLLAGDDLVHRFPRHHITVFHRAASCAQTTRKPYSRGIPRATPCTSATPTCRRRIACPILTGTTTRSTAIRGRAGGRHGARTLPRAAPPTARFRKYAAAFVDAAESRHAHFYLARLGRQANFLIVGDRHCAAASLPVGTGGYGARPGKVPLDADPHRTMLGAAQVRSTVPSRVESGLERRRAAPMAQRTAGRRQQRTDGWDGYPGGQAAAVAVDAIIESAIRS